MPEFDGFRYGQVGNFDPNNMTILYPIGMEDLVYALAQPLGNVAYLIKTQPNHNLVKEVYDRHRRIVEATKSSGI